MGERPASGGARRGLSPSRTRRIPGCALSVRELEVLRLVASGATIRSAARKLGIAPATVKVHLENARTAVGAETTADAIARARAHGWLEGPLAVRPPKDRFRRLLDCPLSPTELTALEAVAYGYGSRERDAARVGMTRRQLARTLSQAYRRLGVHSEGDALALCYRRGWLDPDVERAREAEEQGLVPWHLRLYLEAFDMVLEARDDERCLGDAKAVTDAVGRRIKVAVRSVASREWIIDRLLPMMARIARRFEMEDHGWVEGRVRESADGLRGRQSAEEQQRRVREALDRSKHKDEAEAVVRRRDDDE